jgi:hypothetical protein
LKAPTLLTLCFAIQLFAQNVNCQSLNLAWAKGFDGTNEEGINDMATDQFGNVYAAGYVLSPTLKIGTVTVHNLGISSLLIIKIKPDGNTQWAETFGGLGISATASSVKIGSDGQIYLAGNFFGKHLKLNSAVIDNTDTSGSTSELLLAMLDTAGNVTSATALGGKGNDYISKIALDDHNDLYVTGSTYGPQLALRNMRLKIEGFTDKFLFKIDNNWHIVWAKDVKDYESDASYVSVHGNRLCFVGNSNSDTTTIDTFSAVKMPSQFADKTFYLACMDTAGNVKWLRKEGYFWCTGGTTFDNNGNMYVTGQSMYHQKIDTFQTGFGGDGDFFLAKFTPSGKVAWVTSTSQPGEDWSFGIASDNSGHILTTGFFLEDSFRLGSLLLRGLKTPFSHDLMFAATFDTSGNALWGTTGVSETGGLFGATIAVSPDGSLFVNGYYFDDNVKFGNTILNKPDSSGFFINRYTSYLSSIETQLSENKIIAYPNPANNLLYFKGIEGEAKVSLYSLEGKKLVEFITKSQKVSADISSLTHGLYIYVIQGEQGIISGKFEKE